MKILIPEKYKNLLEDKIKKNYFICKVSWGITLLASIIVSIFFGIQMLLIGAVIALFIGYYYYTLCKKENDKENLVFIEANCKKRKISGYRLQYHTSTFEYRSEDGEERFFKITHSDKNKFLEGQTYFFCIHLPIEKELSDISLSDVLSYCIKKDEN